MTREELLDNLRASLERGETVELDLYPNAAEDGRTLVGRIVALGPEYSSRPRTKAAIETGPANALRYHIIGLTMIKDLRVRGDWP